MAQRLRIFVSSPADVPDERLRADLIIDKLSQDFSRFFTIESYRWEHEAMLASKTFQDAIEPPSAFDIVILILWSRLGTPLPERTAEREYHGIDGRAPVTGTEWEYEEALKAAREKQAPDLLAFRNVSQAPIETRDSEARARSIAQLDALDAFWRRHFVDRGAFLAAYDEYRTLEEFAKRLEESLRKLIERRIKDATAGVTGAPIWLHEPFRGLEPYEFEHAPIFFGRDAAVMKATEQLAANARSGHAFLLVSGASGSGKSSLVKAGMVPRLMKLQRISGAAPSLKRSEAAALDESVDTRDLAGSYQRFGDVQVAQGDLAAALQSYRDSLAIADRLAKSDPGNAGWQGDLSTSYERVGDVQVAQGDLGGALTSYSGGLAIFERLAKSGPDNAGWQRDLSVSYAKVGDVQMAQGDLAGALKSYRDTLAIFERLAKSDPDNAGWQRDLSVAYSKVGDVVVAQGDLAAALQSYRDSLAIRERLAKSDPGNAGWQRDLAMSYASLAVVYRRSDDRNNALATLRQGQAIMERLVTLAPDNAGWKELLVSFKEQIAALTK